jgi:acetylornithine/succinyldiaminopimelate/putrescine aminotransferase
VVAAAACAVVEAIDDALLVNVRDRGSELEAGLAAFPAVRSVRGMGLLLGAELDRPVGPVVDACRDRGLLVLSAGPEVLRLTPPLVVDAAQVAEALTTIEGVLAS